MAEYIPIHPERPLRRAAVAVAVSLGLHAGLLALLAAVALAAISASKKREGEQPKAVALAEIDPERWEANRRLVKPEFETRFRKAPDGAVPASGIPGERPVDGRDLRLLPGSSPKGWTAEEGSETPSQSLDPGAPPAQGPTLDLRPRPLLPSGPVDLSVKTFGEGGAPFAQGTNFGGLAIQHPEAWRYGNFVERVIDEMNAALRYKLGDPVPQSVREKINPRYYFVAEVWVSVTIDREGKVLDAHIRRSTGLADLDALLVRIIYASSPFVNLPPGLLGDGGLYKDSWHYYYMH